MAKKKTTAKRPKAKKPKVQENDPVQAARDAHPEGSDRTAFPEVEKR